MFSNVNVGNQCGKVREIRTQNSGQLLLLRRKNGDEVDNTSFLKLIAENVSLGFVSVVLGAPLPASSPRGRSLVQCIVLTPSPMSDTEWIWWSIVNFHI